MIFFFLAPLSVNAAIYQYKDENGNISFSDKPVDGAKRLKESKPSVAPVPKRIKNPSPVSTNKSEEVQSSVQEKKKKTAKRYKWIKITNPKDDLAIRSNNGDLEITVLLKPALQTKFGHEIQLILDGKKLTNRWRSNSILLNNIDRGTHILSAIVVNKRGKKLKQSKQITFHLLRHSILLSR